MVELQRTML